LSLEVHQGTEAVFSEVSLTKPGTIWHHNRVLVLMFHIWAVLGLYFRHKIC